MDILQKEHQVDLSAYDILFKRFVRGEWGRRLVRNPQTIATNISKFLIRTE